MEEGINMADIFDVISKQMQFDNIDIADYSPLTLAYIGDVVYEIIIRTMVVTKANKSANKLHRETSSFVKAETQANMIKIIMDSLTEDEQAVYKRGRNAKSFSKAKNATMIDYRMATGFEALIGYLYLTNQSSRMCELIKTGIKGLNNEV
ncbi:MAG: Mini-ribonuclease 3 [Eubacterium sp.]